MNETGKKRTSPALLALFATVIGVAIGVVISQYWPERQDDAGAALAARKCATPPEVAAAIQECRKNSELTREELNALRVQVAEIYQAAQARSGDTSGDHNLRAALPPPYLLQVDSFFQTEAALNLLSAKSRPLRLVSMGKPRFVTPQVITVPYTKADQTNYLMVSITILDYYDLQFDVLWDSMEADERP